MRSCLRVFLASALALALGLAFGTLVLSQTDPLPSWNDGAAKQRGWVVISMKHDWARIFAFE